MSADGHVLAGNEKSKDCTKAEVNYGDVHLVHSATLQSAGGWEKVSGRDIWDGAWET